MRAAIESIQPIRTNHLPVRCNVTYMKDGTLNERPFDLSLHESRVALSKLIQWAMNQKIELRIRPE